MTCVCGFACSAPPDSALWHELHEVVHVAIFPRSNTETRANLRRMAQSAHERTQRAGVTS